MLKKSFYLVLKDIGNYVRQYKYADSRDFIKVNWIIGKANI
jgi:hypothetical protein